MNSEPQYPIALAFDPLQLNLALQANNPRDGLINLAVTLDAKGCIGLAVHLLRGALMQHPELLADAAHAVDAVLDDTAAAVCGAAQALNVPTTTQ